MLKRLLLRWLSPEITHIVQEQVNDPKYLKKVKDSILKAEEHRALHENEQYLASMRDL